MHLISVWLFAMDVICGQLGCHWKERKTWAWLLLFLLLLQCKVLFSPIYLCRYNMPGSVHHAKQNCLFWYKRVIQLWKRNIVYNLIFRINLHNVYNDREAEMYNYTGWIGSGWRGDMTLHIHTRAYTQAENTIHRVN